MQAAETATAESLARLARLGDGCLVLTARARDRARAADQRPARLLCLPLSEAIDLETVRRLTDPTHGGRPPSRSGGAQRAPRSPAPPPRSR